MGFSVSGSAAIIFASMFIAFGMWYTASANSFERVTEARQAQTEDALSTKNAEIKIVSATHFAGNDTLRIEANNTGAAQLRLNDTDLLVDGQYVTDWQADATVAGKGNTDLWLSGEQLTVELSRTNQPDRVKIVTETGIADTAGVA